MGGQQVSESEQALFKALVTVRWRNRLTRARNNIAPGQVVEFEAGDFNDGTDGPALVSLADVLARGLFAPWDPEHAGDPDYMSRDELLHYLNDTGAVTEGGEPWPHNANEADLRAAVAASLDARKAERRSSGRKGR